MRSVRTSPNAAGLALLLIASTAVLPGCGGDDGAATTQPAPSPEQQVLATWRAAASEAADGNGTAFCAKVAPAGKAKLTARTSLPCEDTVRLLGSQLTPAERAAVRGAKVTSVTVDRNGAVVHYESTPRLARYGFTGRTELTRSDGRWLLLGI